jgi:glycosyltransferase involved in cell wall biosynthesis
MHVGFLTLESPFDTAGGGGIAAYLRAVIPALVRAGHCVTVVTNSRHAPGEAARGDGVRVLNVRLPSLHWYCSRLPLLGDALALPLRQVEWSLKFSAAVNRLVEKDPVDVLESSELGALFLARRPVAPLVVRLHGSDYVFRKYSGQPLHRGARWNHRLEQAVWRRARALTSPSRFQADEVAEEMNWAAGGVDVIPNPITAEVLAEALRQGADGGSSAESPVILYTGRLAVVKGTTPLLEAVPRVRRLCPSARFVLAGPWQMPDSPENWGLRKGGLPGREGVSWLGHVPWQGLIDWYRRATVFVMPSMYETFGISCLEAMAFGLAVVATRAGGLPEVVEDGVTGLLVPPGDAPALAGAVHRLLADPALRRRLGEAGRERVLSTFTAERVVRATVPVYERARGSPPRSKRAGPDGSRPSVESFSAGRHQTGGVGAAFGEGAKRPR